MSIQAVRCPGCGVTVNVPMTMTNVKCPSCETIWNVNHPEAAQRGASAKAARDAGDQEQTSTDNSNAAIIAALVGGAMVLVAIVGISIMLINQAPPPSAKTAETEETIKPRIPEEYREVDLPEEQRRRIYNDYRSVARTTIEQPLILPQGTKVRKSLEDMLEKTYDRELVRFAVLHNIEVEDVLEIIKEGDAKVWDDRPRSHAVRDGKRVYDKEMSEGWKQDSDIK